MLRQIVFCYFILQICTFNQWLFSIRVFIFTFAQCIRVFYSLHISMYYTLAYFNLLRIGIWRYLKQPALHPFQRQKEHKSMMPKD